MKEFMTPLYSTLETPISVALTVLVVWILKNLIRDIVKATGLKELEFTKGGLKAIFSIRVRSTPFTEGSCSGDGRETLETLFTRLRSLCQIEKELDKGR